tara:strand:+ start:169 stop:543 length:375 start_codon:yes stop_codon:yes gene_type:complete
MKLNVEEIKENYPFLSLVQVGKIEQVGIIQNADPKVLSIYCVDSVPKALIEDFLQFGQTWWWESNRKLPINIFIGKDFIKFKNALKTFSAKDCSVSFGPVTRLTDLTKDKRIRRKTIQLVRRVK